MNDDNDRLTAAERAIAALVAGGYSNQQIARLRGTAPRTIANQLAGLYRKLGVTSRVEMAHALDAQLDEGEAITPTAVALQLLSETEKQTLETAARGVPIKVIAIDLGLAPHTIGARLRRCAHKLGMGSRITLLRACGRASHGGWDRSASSRG